MHRNMALLRCNEISLREAVPEKPAAAAAVASDLEVLATAQRKAEPDAFLRYS